MFAKGSLLALAFALVGLAAPQGALAHDDHPVCGDGVVVGGEECDDGNTVDFDGCSAKCDREQCVYTQGYWKNHEKDWPYGTLDNELCDELWLDILASPVAGDKFIQLAHQYLAAKLNILNGASTSAEVVAAMTAAEALLADCEISDDEEAKEGELNELLTDFNEGLVGLGPQHCGDCGNGELDGTEECDDGNTDSGDGCSKFCQVEDDPFCGDGIVQPELGETCDPKDPDAPADCDDTCTYCGDGIVDDDEECEPVVYCDDHDKNGVCDRVQDCDDEKGDCEPVVECTDECTFPEPFCGDGIVQPELGETCDPKDPDAPADCDETCSYCGDGIIDPGEECEPVVYCDDKHGCKTVVECNDDCTLPEPFCGDGVVQPDLGETCDPKDPDAPADCRDDCTYCGDGVVDTSEQCDGGDLCGDDCRFLPYCGDGIVTPEIGETCDPEAPEPPADCDGTCTYCGDGIVDEGEECEPVPACDHDKHDCEPDPACSDECTIVEPFCGDGVLDPGEECDDGNNEAGDGCDPRCRIEDERCGCLDLDQDGWPHYYGPCREEAGDKNNRWVPECQSFNDCADDDPTIHPFAIEIPNDGIDQNCNSVMKCGAFDDDDAGARWAALLFLVPFAGIYAIRRSRVRR